MTINHDETRQRFFVHTDHGDAVVDYRRDGQAVDFTHTYVPPAARGQGIAEALVKNAIAWAESQELEIHASCWYVDRYLAATRRRQRQS